MNYEIIRYELGDGAYMLVLTQTNKLPFIKKLASNPKTKEDASIIVKAAKRVSVNGVEWAKQAKVLKAIDNNLSLFELRISGRVVRVMTYLGKDEPVYLFSFDGHQGKTGKIPKSIIKKGKQIAQLAEQSLEG